MSQLVVNDLDFCHTELSQLKGSGWLNIKVGVRVRAVAAPPNGLGYGTATGVAIGIGQNADGTTPEAFVFTNAEGFRFI